MWPTPASGPTAMSSRTAWSRSGAADAAAFVRASIGALAAPQYSVEVLVQAAAATVRNRVGQWAAVDEVDDSCCRLRMSVDNLDWPTLALGSIGADFRVLGPPELEDHIREWGARFARACSHLA